MREARLRFQRAILLVHEIGASYSAHLDRNIQGTLYAHPPIAAVFNANGKCMPTLSGRISIRKTVIKSRLTRYSPCVCERGRVGGRTRR